MIEVDDEAYARLIQADVIDAKTGRLTEFFTIRDAERIAAAWHARGHCGGVPPLDQEYGTWEEFQAGVAAWVETVPLGARAEVVVTQSGEVTASLYGERTRLLQWVAAIEG